MVNTTLDGTKSNSTETHSDTVVLDIHDALYRCHHTRGYTLMFVAPLNKAPLPLSAAWAPTGAAAWGISLGLRV
jgi:hypothetical protein